MLWQMSAYFFLVLHLSLCEALKFSVWKEMSYQSQWEQKGTEESDAYAECGMKNTTD